MLEVIDFHQGILHRNVVFRSCEYFQCILKFHIEIFIHYEILMSAQAFLFLTSDSAAFRKAKLTCRHFSSSTSKYLIHHHPKAHIVAKCLPTHQTHQRIIKYIQVPPCSIQFDTETLPWNNARKWMLSVMLRLCMRYRQLGVASIDRPTWWVFLGEI